MALPAATIKDYVGRKSDLLAFDYIEKSRELDQSLVGPGRPGALITGIHKLTQWFLLELLTENGSQPYNSRAGTLFMLEARLGLWRTSADVFSSFSSAMLDIREHLRNTETADDPAEERLQDARLTNVTLSGELAILTVEITSRAGDSRSVVLPLRTSLNP